MHIHVARTTTTGVRYVYHRSTSTTSTGSTCIPGTCNIVNCEGSIVVYYTKVNVPTDQVLFYLPSFQTLFKPTVQYIILSSTRLSLHYIHTYMYHCQVSLLYFFIVLVGILPIHVPTTYYR